MSEEDEGVIENVNENKEKNIEINEDKEEITIENESAPPITQKSRNLTFRALLIGSLIGSLVCSSNIYIGLKTGWSLGSSVFASIIGFVSIRFISNFLRTNSTLINFLIGGDKENEKENCLLTTAAVAAGGLVAGFVAAIPALAWFGYYYTPFELLLWAISAGFFGMFFSIPIRYYAFITKNLKFPSGISTAVAINSMYNSTSGSSLAILQAKVLVIAFLIGFTWTVITQYIPFLYNMPIFAYFTWFPLGIGGIMKQIAIWRWSINLSPAFIGTGMIVGMRVSISYFIGSIVAWGILAPITLHFHWVSSNFGYSDPINNPSSQYWLLWVGVSMMVSTSLFELFLAYNFYHIFLRFKTFLFSSIKKLINKNKNNNNNIDNSGNDDNNIKEEIELSIEMDELNNNNNNNNNNNLNNNNENNNNDININNNLNNNIEINELEIENEIIINNNNEEEEEEEEKEKDLENNEGEFGRKIILKTNLTASEVKEIDSNLQQIPRSWWSIGLSITVIFTFFVMTLFFHVLWYEVILSMLLGFFLSFIVIQAAGETDISPLLVVGKLTQLIFAGVSPGNYNTNLLAANVPSSASSQAVGMICDLKTGLLLRVSPKEQFISQAVGSVFGVVFSVVTYLIMITAYPCIIHIDEVVNCNFQVPAAAAWYGVAFALNSDAKLEDCFPKYCVISMVISALFGILVPLCAHYSSFVKKYFLSVNAFAMPFVINQPYLASALMIGSLTTFLWGKFAQKHFQKFGIVFASGLSAGEGVGGLLLAALAIAGFDQQWCLFVPDYLPYICKSG